MAPRARVSHDEEPVKQVTGLCLNGAYLEQAGLGEPAGLVRAERVVASLEGSGARATRAASFAGELELDPGELIASEDHHRDPRPVAEVLGGAATGPQSHRETGGKNGSKRR